jgi:predicted amidohydrolase
MKLKLAAYQGRAVDGEPDRNLDTVRRVMQEAGEQTADFLCFPETFLSGYGDRDVVERGAMPADDPRLAALGKEAEGLGMVLLVGFSERLTDGRVGNSVAIFDGERRLGTYRKTMLTGGDYREMGFAVDLELPVWQAKGITFGCIVCADSSYFETAATMAYKGASLLFSPHFNYIPVDRMDQHRVRVRNNHVGLAALLELYVVRANVIVDHRPRRLGYGDSAIFDPDGRAIAEAGLFTERLIVADAELTDDRAAGRSRLRSRVPMEVRERLAEAMRAHPPEEW